MIINLIFWVSESSSTSQFYHSWQNATRLWNTSHGWAFNRIPCTFRAVSAILTRESWGNRDVRCGSPRWTSNSSSSRSNCRFLVRPGIPGARWWNGSPSGARSAINKHLVARISWIRFPWNSRLLGRMLSRLRCWCVQVFPFFKASRNLVVKRSKKGLGKSKHISISFLWKS